MPITTPNSKDAAIDLGNFNDKNVCYTRFSAGAFCGGSAAERQFTTTTLGGQYFLNKKTSVRLNYEIRDAEAPNLASSARANVILGGLDNRVSAQVMMIF